MRRRVHRIVAEHWKRNPKNYPIVNHLDGDKLNNHADNLQWCTASMNNQHALDTGLRKGRGEGNHFAKLTEDDVREIRRLIKSKEMKQRDMAKIYGVSESTITDIKTRKSWKHLSKEPERLDIVTGLL